MWTLPIALAALVIAGFSLAGGRTEPARPLATSGTFWVAMLMILYTYDGWNEATYIAGEVHKAGQGGQTGAKYVFWSMGLGALIEFLKNGAGLHVFEERVTSFWRYGSFKGSIAVGGATFGTPSQIGAMPLSTPAASPAAADIDDDGVVTEEERALAGESWDVSRVILSWEDVDSRGSPGEAYNVVIHEFAHYLDHESGGAPWIAGAEARRGWQRMLDSELEALRQRADAGQRSFLDPYGAEDRGEFFAVASEAFFEEPLAFARELPSLYRALAELYRLDPAAWVRDAR